jgi:peroxiredoxin
MFVRYGKERRAKIAAGSICCIALLAAAAAGAEASPEQEFQAAHQHFLEGRELQRLHRNNDASRHELQAAAEGYRAVVDRYPHSSLAARALYMSGSAELFLDAPDKAIAAYGAVVERYPSDRNYLAKALVRKAATEKDDLDPTAARHTLAEYAARFGTADSSPQGKEAARLQRSLRVIGQRAPALEAARWFHVADKPPTLQGGLSLLYFFATWCPNCRKEVDFIVDVDRRFRPRGLQLIGITRNTRGQTDADVAHYVEEHGFGFPVAVDADGKTSRAYEGGSVPTAVVVDRHGIVRWHDHPAALSDGVLERLLAEDAGA